MGVEGVSKFGAAVARFLSKKRGGRPRGASESLLSGASSSAVQGQERPPGRDDAGYLAINQFPGVGKVLAAVFVAEIMT